jgi:plasmid stabilization system protein ParE
VNHKRRVDVTDAARAQIEVAAAWWDQNRPSAAGAILEDLDRILALLTVQPEMGTPARRMRLSGVHRVTLTRIRYNVYYRVTAVTIQVLPFWHTSRGSEPPL